MQALIPTTSPLYGKRLVKEIKAIFNKAAEGVYLDASVAAWHCNPRIHSIRFQSNIGRIVVKSNQGSFMVEPAQWAQAFFDGYGRPIYASRHASASYGYIQAK